MQWDLESSVSVNQAFDRLGESNRVFSNIIAIQFEQIPEEFPVYVSGTSTCPGCGKVYDFNIEAYKDFDARNQITCSNPACGGVYTVYAVYRPSRSEGSEIVPIYLYADLYTTLKGQQLSRVVIDKVNVK